jgi:predicted DNA-binding transcriptional regulator AlpA
MPELDEPLLSPRDVASILGLGSTQTYALLATSIPVARLSARCLRVRPADLRAWVASRVGADDDG